MEWVSTSLFLDLKKFKTDVFVDTSFGKVEKHLAGGGVGDMHERSLVNGSYRKCSVWMMFDSMIRNRSVHDASVFANALDLKIDDIEHGYGLRVGPNEERLLFSCDASNAVIITVTIN